MNNKKEPRLNIDEYTVKNYILDFYQECTSLMQFRMYIYVFLLVSLIGISFLMHSLLVIAFAMLWLLFFSIDVYLSVRKIQFYRMFLNSITSSNYETVLKNFNFEYERLEINESFYKKILNYKGHSF